MSIRLRLTLLYSAILALTLVAFSAILYAIQAQYTLSVLRRDLAQSAQRVSGRVVMAARFWERTNARPGVPRPIPEEGEFGQQALRDLRVRDIVHVYDAHGTAIEGMFGWSDDPLPLSDAGLEAVLGGDAWFEIATVEDERMLIHTGPVMVQGQTAGFVQVGRSLAERDRSLAALGGTLIAGSLVTILAAFGVGWALSGITLRPIHRITQTAQAIGAERDFGRRVEYDGPRDEVGRLAITFNDMLSELQDAYRQVEGALEMQQNFVADVSHELRTPLTTIRGNLALLRRVPLAQEEEREDILDDVVDESDRLIGLVSDLLALARAQAGRQLQIEPVPVRPLIEDVCRQAKLLDPARAIDPQDLPEAAVLADRDALKQVLLALIDNAIKHTDGPIAVTAQGVASDAGAVVEIGVHDQGPGIDPEVLAHLFERYTRGERARKMPGLGLGLSIAKALIESQDGTLAAENKLDGGSVFTVVLPQAEGMEG
jgi:signal transduction histidine kinase